MHNVLIIFYIAFSIGNLFILPELCSTSELFLPEEPISHVKYEVVKGTDVYQPYFSLAEIEFYEVVRELVDPEAE